MTTELETVNETTGEIVAVNTDDRKLVFGTQDPERIIERATEVANRLKDIVEKAKLYNMIPSKQGPRKYVRAEGWTAMIAMLGVFPSSVYCHRLDRTKDEIAYEAKIILKHLSGHQLGAGEAICSSNEKNWAGRDEYAIKSMAQTRAVGKACRLSFSWIMALAGYEATPAEEMDNVKPYQKEEEPAGNPGKPADIEFPSTPEEVNEKAELPITEKQAKFLFFKWKEAGHTTDQLKLHLKAQYGIEASKDLKRGQLQTILDLLETEQPH